MPKFSWKLIGKFIAYIGGTGMMFGLWGFIIHDLPVPVSVKWFIGGLLIMLAGYGIAADNELDKHTKVPSSRPKGPPPVKR